MKTCRLCSCGASNFARLCVLNCKRYKETLKLNFAKLQYKVRGGLVGTVIWFEFYGPKALKIGEF